MMLRIQLERMQGAFFPSLREYFTLFGMTPSALRRAKPDVIIMHPGPMNRGVEIASEVADGPYSVILDQVANGVAVRMAVLYLLAGGAGAMKRLLKGGRVVDPARGIDGVFDVLIEDGAYRARSGRDLRVDGRRGDRDPAAGSSCPGFIDMHVHLREPGQEHKETIATRRGRGGRGRLHRRGVHAEHRSGERPRRRHRVHPQGAREASLARVYPIGAVSRGSQGRAAGRDRANCGRPAAWRCPTTGGRWRRRC